ncbi:COX15/CtaA family protein [Mariniblastus sp.]|jgi:heme a synthase|nr:COX15/CtaA family protein [Mariniblastus sp.]MDA7923049.1 COX15/CtaA family protein [bacterium]MDA7903071.1 COX15/CtaA family protein [Mariniblastus sp.]MDB4385958.1 COX15/CtaA family protein [bacterium]MDB4399678.1 COX15/CtaA family protein [bacterium]
MIVNRLAWITLVCLIILVIVGATVRVTGSGLGCPDWPTCWGCLIPPTHVDQIDVDKLDLEKFKRHAVKKGIDPDTITRETVLDSFDPVHTWIEFGNRLTSLPLGLASLLLAIFSFTAKRHRGWIILLSWLGLLDVIGNAIMGALVVKSGLQPGIITLHMGLAFLLICMMVSVVFLSRPSDNSTAIRHIDPKLKKQLLVVSLLFFAFLFCEGLMGSQLREQTDEFAKIADGLSRDQWADKLGETWIYKVHRSFSWSLLITAGLIFYWVKKKTQLQLREPKLIVAMVISMMLMGIILAHISVYQVIQVLHVGMTAVLLAVTWHWIMRLYSLHTNTAER